MTNEIHNSASAVLTADPEMGNFGVASRRAVADHSDYDQEDCGCRAYRRGQSFEFVQILRVLAESR
ncbi:MAG TPA: hypothetical protein VJT08_04450 [Terriglobales bacterium]|nr:hypothetical protein [Terriglobales bacterium]